MLLWKTDLIVGEITSISITEKYYVFSTSDANVVEINEVAITKKYFIPKAGVISE